MDALGWSLPVWTVASLQCWPGLKGVHALILSSLFWAGGFAIVYFRNMVVDCFVTFTYVKPVLRQTNPILPSLPSLTCPAIYLILLLLKMFSHLPSVISMSMWCSSRAWGTWPWGRGSSPVRPRIIAEMWWNVETLSRRDMSDDDLANLILWNTYAILRYLPSSLFTTSLNDSSSSKHGQIFTGHDNFL